MQADTSIILQIETYLVKENIMTKGELNELFKQADLSKKEFAAIVGLSSSTVHGWGSGQNIPRWVHSWFVNYIEAKTLQELRQRLEQIEKLKSK